MYLPLLFQTTNMPCLLVGGGEVASRKVSVLLYYQSIVTVISPEIETSIAEHVDNSRLKWLQREYQSGDCAGYQLILAATSDRQLNMQVSQEARLLGIPVNVVDDPELCTVIFPAIQRDGDLSIAVSTGGKAPYMAGEIRNRIAEMTSEWGYWVTLAGKFREIVTREVEDISMRKTLYDYFVNIGPIPTNMKPPKEESLEYWLAWFNGIQEGYRL